MIGTQKQYAAHRGCSPAYVTKLRQAGRLVLVDAPEGTRVDFEASDRLVAATQDQARRDANSLGAGVTPPPAAPGPAAGADDGDDDAPAASPYMQARAVREAVNAKMARITLEERAGALVRKAEVAQAAGETARGLRDALTALPSKLGPVFASETDEHVIATRLQREIGDALREYARVVRERLGDGIGDAVGSA